MPLFCSRASESHVSVVSWYLSSTRSVVVMVVVVVVVVVIIVVVAALFISHGAGCTLSNHMVCAKLTL